MTGGWDDSPGFSVLMSTWSMAIVLSILLVILSEYWGDIVLGLGIPLGVLLTSGTFLGLYRVHRTTWFDQRRDFDDLAGPVEDPIEAALKEAEVPFRTLGPWQGEGSWGPPLRRAFLLEDGTRIMTGGPRGTTVFVGPELLSDEVERLMALVERALGASQ